MKRFASLLPLLALFILVACNTTLNTLSEQNGGSGNSVPGVAFLPPIGGDVDTSGFFAGAALRYAIYRLEGDVATELLSPSFATADGSIQIADDHYYADWKVRDTLQAHPGVSQFRVYVWRDNAGTGAACLNQPWDGDSPCLLGTFDARIRVGRKDRDAGILELNRNQNLPIKVFVESGGEIVSLAQANHFEMGWSGGTSAGDPLLIPSTDAAGIAYHPPSGHLFISDSEINEIPDAFAYAGGNIFEISLTGDTLYDTFNLDPDDKGKNREPSGIAYCPQGIVDGDPHGHFHISHDNTPTGVWLYELSGGDLNWEDQVTSPKGRDADLTDNDDPEDVSCDTNTGLKYVVNGFGLNILVFSWSASYTEPNPGPFSRLPTTHYKLENNIDLVSMNAGNPAGIPSDAEGIYYDAASDQILIVSDPDKAIFVYDVNGVFVRKFDISGLVPGPVSPQGLTLAPSSDGLGGESLYIVDARRDNNIYPDERDAAVYELSITRSP